MLNFKIFTIFPDLFPQILNTSITGEALKKGLWNLQVINIRDYAFDARKTIDDVPFGGGAGMLFRVDVLYNALKNNISDSNNSANFVKKNKIIYLSPRGKLFTQEMAQELAKFDEISLICGSDEGIDQRIFDLYDIEEVSIGDYVLSGGEIASYVVIDAITRNIDGVLGAKESLDVESFGNQNCQEYKYLLEYPQYTRPNNFMNLEVPAVLTSGHHDNIKKWQKAAAIAITQKNRPDLYAKYLAQLKNISSKNF